MAYYQVGGLKVNYLTHITWSIKKVFRLEKKVGLSYIVGSCLTIIHLKEKKKDFQKGKS